MIDLVLPLAGLTTKPMNEDESALCPLGVNIDDGQLYGWRTGDAYFLAVEFQINFHAASVHEMGWLVNHK